MKKVLIVTSSPFNNTKLGKMCSQLMCYLKSKGIPVAVAAWDHDTSWYVEDDEGVCWYKYNEQKVGPVYTVFNKGEGAPTQLYDVIKKLQIDTVLSIGDFSDVEHIYAIKTLEKDNIEWINILNNGSYPINRTRMELINSIDFHILLNKLTVDEFKQLKIPKSKYSYEKWGSIFNGEGIKPATDKFGVVCVAKNCNQSNLGCFIKAVSLLKHCIKEEDLKDIRFYLHTNLYDDGDYDIEYLLDRYDLKDIIELPEDFIGVNDGIPNVQFKEKLKKYDVIVDCSCQSATAISVLDGMALGLVPLVSEVGALAEIGRKFNSGFPHRIDHRISGVKFLAADEKEFYIAEDMDLFSTIHDLYQLWQNKQFSGPSLRAQNFSKNYDLDVFLENTYKIIKEFTINNDKLVVETF